MKHCTKNALDLDPDEFITYFAGRAGHCIDRLTIRTSKGRQLDAGGMGGMPFDFQVPQGYTVAALKGGFGEHLHSIGVVYGPIQMPQMPGQQYPGYGQPG